MEDLGDETLAQVGTPKNKSRSDSPMLRKIASSRIARDDHDIMKHSGARPPAMSCSSISSAENNDDDDVGTRRVFDKRELRRRHKALFDQQIAQWRAQHLNDKPASSSES